jgi:hypothetical protein
MLTGYPVPATGRLQTGSGSALLPPGTRLPDAHTHLLAASCIRRSMADASCSFDTRQSLACSAQQRLTGRHAEKATPEATAWGIRCGSSSSSSSAAERSTPAVAVLSKPQVKWPGTAIEPPTHHDFHRAAAPGAAVERHRTPASHAGPHCDLTQRPGRLLQLKFRFVKGWVGG